MFTYFHLNYEQSLIPPGVTVAELAAPAPGPNNAQNQTIWIMQSYAIDPSGTLPSLQRVCSSLGCADVSPGQIPVYMGGYQLQVQQPFTAVRQRREAEAGCVVLVLNLQLHMAECASYSTEFCYAEGWDKVLYW